MFLGRWITLPGKHRSCVVVLTKGNVLPTEGASCDVIRCQLGGLPRTNDVEHAALATKRVWSERKTQTGVANSVL